MISERSVLVAFGRFNDGRSSSQSGPDASAQSSGESRDQAGTYVNLITSSPIEIAGHKAERRPGAGEERLAATKHEGMEVESILINETKVG